MSLCHSNIQEYCKDVDKMNSGFDCMILLLNN